MIKFEKKNPKTSEAIILEFEKQFNQQLPEEYKTFILSINGGVMSNYIYVTYEDKEFGEDVRLYITEFFGFNAVEQSFNLVTDEIKSENRILRTEIRTWIQNLIAIARIDNGHDYIVISSSGDNKGMVYVIGDELPTFEYAQKLAENFNEFLAMIRFEPSNEQ